MPQIVQLSDIHLLEEREKRYHQFVSALADVKQRFPELQAIVFTGDLASHPTTKTYELFNEVLTKLSIPIYIIPGNHDNDYLIKKTIIAPNIYHNGSVYIDKWLLIFLDSSLPGEKLGSGRLSSKELSRLQAAVDDTRNEQILIFMHHPPISLGAPWFQEICLENQTDFHNIIKNKKNVKAVIFGHIHAQMTLWNSSHLYISAPSTWRQIDHSIQEKATYDKLPGGYNWFDLGENNLQFGTYYLV